VSNILKAGLKELLHDMFFIPAENSSHELQ